MKGVEASGSSFSWFFEGLKGLDWKFLIQVMLALKEEWKPDLTLADIGKEKAAGCLFSFPDLPFKACKC